VRKEIEANDASPIPHERRGVPLDAGTALQKRLLNGRRRRRDERRAVGGRDRRESLVEPSAQELAATGEKSGDSALNGRRVRCERRRPRRRGLERGVDVSPAADCVRNLLDNRVGPAESLFFAEPARAAGVAGRVRGRDLVASQDHGRHRKETFGGGLSQPDALEEGVAAAHDADEVTDGEIDFLWIRGAE
jgi:hypothetical protein